MGRTISSEGFDEAKATRIVEMYLAHSLELRDHVVLATRLQDWGWRLTVGRELQPDRHHFGGGYVYLKFDGTIRFSPVPVAPEDV